MTADDARLKRPRHPLPEFIRGLLRVRGLMEAYQARPAHQRNDCIGWITRAKRPKTREKRLHQMLAELERGGVYMNMLHPPSAK